MPNVVAIIQDDRARRQTEQFLQELGMETLRFATFQNHQEFTALYFRDKAPPPEEQDKDKDEEKNRDKKTDESPGDLKLFSEVNLMIFALDSIGEKSKPWLDSLKRNLIRYKHWPAVGTLRVIMLKYEDDGIGKLDVMHPLLDDLIYLPMDRLVFLQKVEIILNLPKVVRPRFLFNQAVQQEIEISKIAKMDRLSDVGLAIRNPIPLKKGLPGHFYVNFPTDKVRLEIRAKVIRSEPHPEFPGQYLVYFTYFGLAKTDLTRIRQSLSKASRYQSLKTDDKAVFRFKPEDLFLEPSENKTYVVAVVDSDEAVVNTISQQISRDMDRVKVISETSYNLFLHKYFELGTRPARIPPKATSLSDFYQNPLALTLGAEDFKCLNAEPPPGDTDLFLGHPAGELFSAPEKWLALLTDQESKLVLEEAVRFALNSRNSDKILILQDVEGNPRAVNISLKKGSADHLVSASFTPASLSDVARNFSTILSKELDALIFDGLFVPEDPLAWMEGLRQRALKVGLIKEASGLKFFLTADNDTRVSERWLNVPDILGLFYKPVDVRQLLFLLSENLPNKNTVYQFENLGWTQPSWNIHVSKNTDLEALSEFGATLKSRLKIVPGTMIYLRRSIYENAPNNCLAARVYACEPHTSEKDCFHVYATYFGINDQFLKFARTWIRENYASQKGKENQ